MAHLLRYVFAEQKYFYLPNTYVCTCVFIANEALRNTACSMEMLLKKKSRLKPTKSIHRLVKVLGNKFVNTIYP